MSDPSFRAAIKAEARTTGVPLRFSYHQWDHMRIMEAARPENRDLVGRVVGDLAREAGKDPFDWYLDHCLDGEMDSLVDCHMFNVDEEQVKDLLAHPHGVLGLSDAGAHLSFLCDAGFGLHMLGHWARDRADLTLEQAVQSVTSRLADVYRIKERGRLKVGACADLLLFDPETVGRGERVRKWDLPAGADRVDTPPIGVEGVWINGRRVVNEEGVMKNGARPGRCSGTSPTEDRGRTCGLARGARPAGRASFRPSLRGRETAGGIRTRCAVRAERRAAIDPAPDRGSGPEPRSDVAVEKSGELRLREGADLGGFHGAVLEQHEGRNAPDAVLGRDGRVLVDIQLCNRDPSVVFFRYIFENRRDHLAGSTPFGPVIHQHRLRRLEHVALEARVRQVDDLVAHSRFLPFTEGACVPLETT